MKRCIGLVIVIYGLAVSAANSSDQSEIGSMTRYVLDDAGLEREYFVFLPSSYAGMQARPVAIFMHGYGGSATGTEAEVAQGLNFYAEKYGYIMVYPQGTWFMAGDSAASRWAVTSWNHLSGNFDSGPDGPICEQQYPRELCPPECGSCGKCGWISCHDDIGFLKKLVSVISTDFHVDPKSVFVAGFSNGAMMTNRIACDASELFAAAALVGGRLERGYECAPTKKLPLLQINGGQDRVVPRDGSVSSGGYWYASTASISEQWNQGESCAAERDPWISPTFAGQKVQCTISCAKTNHPAIDCAWAEGDHRWPGTPGLRGSNGYCATEIQSASMPEQSICSTPDYTIDKWGSRLMFEFFDEHRGN